MMPGMNKPAPAPSLEPLHIFRPGRHTALSGATLEFTAADLAASAAAYDPARHEAPLVVGHPALDAPAYGWVQALQHSASGLQAQPHQVQAEFAELVRQGRFKKISASFWLPDAPGNPAPGVYYLRHVGFLGAAAPAVQGLRAPAFGASDGGVETLEFAAPSQPLAPNPDQESPVTPDEKAALQAENQRLKAELAQASAAAAAQAAAARHAEHAAFCDALLQAGRLTPALAPVLVATLDFVGAQEQVVEFAHADTRQPLLGALKSALQALPPLIDFAERSAAPASAGTAQAAAFAAPSGLEVDAHALELHRRALAHAQAHKTDYLAAVAAVQQGAPA